jgi:hypothetical protein
MVMMTRIDITTGRISLVRINGFYIKTRFLSVSKRMVHNRKSPRRGELRGLRGEKAGKGGYQPFKTESPKALSLEPKTTHNFVTDPNRIEKIIPPAFVTNPHYFYKS